MVKRNGSLAGKGMEILYGKKPDEESPVGGALEAVSTVEAGKSSSALPEEATEPLDPEWAASLEAEAGAVEVQPGGEDLFAAGTPAADQGRPDWALPVIEDEDRPAAPEPEVDMMLLATTPVVETPVVETPVVETPVVETPLPDLATTPIGESAPVSPTIVQPAIDQPYARPQPTSQPASSYTPPVQPVTSTPATAPLPTPRDKVEAWVSTPKAVLGEPLYVTAPRTTPEQLVQETGVGMGDLLPDKLQDTDTGQPSNIREEAEVISAVPRRERVELWEEINGLYERVAQELATHKDQKIALSLLREAQDIWLEKPRQFDEAKYKVNQVKILLQKRDAVISSTKTTAWRIFAYDIAWIVLLLGTFFLFNPNFSKAGVVAAWETMLWGGIGGVATGFYGLYRHTSEVQDFDKQYTMWYVAQPIIGLILGLLIQLIVGSGFLAVSIEGTASVMEWVLRLLAFLAGFRQQFIFDLIASVVDRLSPQREKPSSSGE